MIIAKVNCSKIDKTKLFKGKSGTYLDLILIESDNDKYDNDYMVCQGVSKEDREKGIKGAILGNAKIFQGKKSKTTAAAKPEAIAEGEDDVPF
jgi:hypothetical protein